MPEPIKTVNFLLKDRYYKKNIRESLDIDMAIVKYGHEKVLNKDNRNFAKINTWKCVLKKIKIFNY